MGTAGNRPGYKVFSINTTIRNPKRNRDFLIHLLPYKDRVMDLNLANDYFRDCLRDGTYTVMDVSQKVLNKLANNQDLAPEEVEKLVLDNPQACGTQGRVMTQLRALKDEGFLWFEGERSPQIHITQLGDELISNKIDSTIIYTKAMLGLQANNPGRSAMYNKSRPFLNTLFVLKELKEQWTPTYERESKGIHLYEFAAFVLSMKDCDYKRAATAIINYRLNVKEKHKTYHYEDMDLINNHLKSLELLPVKADTLDAYADDVFRKFEMTGLVYKRGGAHKLSYMDYAPGNCAKIDIILEKFADYKYRRFVTPKEYADSMDAIDLPWLNNETLRWRIVRDRAQTLNFTLDASWTLDYCEIILDRLSSQSALEKAKEKYSLEDINHELLILAKHSKDKHKKEFEGLPDSLLLEYLIALMVARQYGTEGLISNILYTPDGQPLSCASGGKADIIYHHKDGSYIFEPTMLSSRDQQLNSETMNIARHAKTEMREYTDSEFRVMMVAPKVHTDVALMYYLMYTSEQVKMLPTTIDRILFLVNKSQTISNLNSNFDLDLDSMRESKDEYVENVNSYRFQLSSIN